MRDLAADEVGQENGRRLEGGQLAIRKRLYGLHLPPSRILPDPLFCCLLPALYLLL